MLTSLLASKIAIVAAASSMVVGGTAAAAYAGALPAGLQDLAHQTIGAQATGADLPEADSSDDATDDSSDDATDDPTDDATDDAGDDTADDAGDEPTDGATDTPKTGVGPDATGPAAFGLCNAYGHGGLSANSVAYASLVKAAGTEADLATYCATVVHPGSADHPHADSTGETRTSHGHKGSGAHQRAKHSHKHG